MVGVETKTESEFVQQFLLNRCSEPWQVDESAVFAHVEFRHDSTKSFHVRDGLEPLCDLSLDYSTDTSEQVATARDARSEVLCHECDAYMAVSAV